MVDKKLRKRIHEFEKDHEIEVGLLTDASYDKSIIGITEDGRAVYSYEKMVQEYMKDEKCDEIDAIEWIDYNTMRSLPYFGDKAPIIIMETPESLAEKY